MTLLTQEWSRDLRVRASHPNLAAARQALDDQLEAYRDSLPPVPDQQAGYYHDFFCAEHATQLRFDHRSPRRHVCPVDGAVFSGEPYDSAWLWSVNDMLSDAALKFAFRWHLEKGTQPGSCRRHRGGPDPGDLRPAVSSSEAGAHGLRGGTGDRHLAESGRIGLDRRGSVGRTPCSAETLLG